MRSYFGKVELLNASGDRLRFVPRELARAMVASGAAQIHNANGKVKAVMLAQPASGFAHRIGEPTEGSASSRFSVREWLDTGQRVWKHHPRATY